MNDRAIVYRRKYNIPHRVGHRRQRAGDGLRQHRRQLRLRRGLHPQPRQRRQRVLRRVPDQRPGRRRRRRRPHAGAGRRAEEGDAEGLRRARSRSAQTLEKHFKDVQDIEFTIQDGKLYMLQTRNGKRTAMAALKFADRHGEGEADRLEDRDHAQPGRPARAAPRADLRPRRGQARPRSSPPACPPAPAPPPARSTSTPIAPCTPPSKGEKVLLVRVETSPEDLRGMIAAEGILTAAAASPRTPRSSPARWARSASAAPPRVADRLRREDRHGRRPDLQGRRLPLDRRHHRQGLRRPGQDRAVRDRRRPDQRRQGRAEDREVQELRSS